MAQISVIVPVYKTESYIHRCVDSILRQTFPDFELILVDDGSPDNCGTICDEYAQKDNRIIVLHQENGGLSAARNAGINWAFANSDSQWLTFVDSDDWIHEQMLETLLKASETFHTNISACNFYRTHGETQPDIHGHGEIYTSKEAYLKHYLAMTVAWGKLYEKECFQDIRYPVGKLHEDEFVTYKLLFAQEKIFVTTQPFYAYFQNSNSITGSKWIPGRMDKLEAYEEQIAFFRQIGEKKLAKNCLQTKATTVIKYIDELKAPDRKDYQWPYLYKLKWMRRWLILRCILEKAMDMWLLELFYPKLMAWIIRYIRPIVKKLRHSQYGEE